MTLGSRGHPLQLCPAHPPQPWDRPGAGSIPQRLCHRFLTSVSSECNKLLTWNRHYSICPVHTAGTALGSPAVLAVGGCSQCFSSLGTAQPRKRKGSSVLAIEAPPRESPQICDQPQCRDWLISLSPNPPWTGLSVKIPNLRAPRGLLSSGAPNSQQKMLKTCPAQLGTSVVLPTWKPEQVWYPKSCSVPDLLHFCSSKLDVSHEPRAKLFCSQNPLYRTGIPYSRVRICQSLTFCGVIAIHERLHF